MLISKFETLLPESGDLMILGDLFDKFDAPSRDVAKVFILLSGWLDFNPANRLYLVAGNHDLSKSSEVYGSFDLLAELLSNDYNNVVVIKQPAMTPWGYVIPHLANQEAFNAALAAVPECDYLFLHCNYDNFFASQSDQSLNLSREQAESCKAKCIVLGHEHQQRMLKKVVIPGNQIASSVSDWLGNSDEKSYTVITDKLELKPACEKHKEYVEQDWKHLEPVDLAFVRVVGDATAEEASQVVTAIAKYREKSKSLVITNAVRIASATDTAGAVTLEGVQSYDVWKALERVLDAESLEVLANLTQLRED
jgi:DNA repair exonuclease SbcCD nuclease subunit